MRFSIEHGDRNFFRDISVQEDGPHDVTVSIACGEKDEDGDYDCDYADITLTAKDAKLLAMMILRIAERAEES